jgi:anti-sigma regulatory factor (Ser/Thr protein kinase)
MATGQQSRLHERRAARPQNIAPLRRVVVAFAAANGATEQQCEDIGLAVSEALTAIIHTPEGRADVGNVVVDARVVEHSLQVVVCDEGLGSLPRDEDAGLGFGFAVIVHLAEAIEIEDEMPGVRMRMTFTIG